MQEAAALVGIRLPKAVAFAFLPPLSFNGVTICITLFHVNRCIYKSRLETTCVVCPSVQSRSVQGKGRPLTSLPCSSSPLRTIRLITNMS